jgi:glycosyltransferase involved in cell wall biosynthesis
VRILHVDHSAIVGGAERSLLELARAQRESGHEVLVVVGRGGDFTRLLAANGVPSRGVGWSPQLISTTRVASSRALLARVPDVARAIYNLRKVIEEWQPDVVQAHTRKAQLLATVAVGGIDVRLVWHLRDALPARPPLRAVVVRALRRADHAVALSQWLARSYNAYGATPRSGQIGLVGSGVDPERLAALPTPWLSGERSPVIGYVGQIARWKGPHLLVEAAEQLEDRGILFRIIGGVWFPAERGYGDWLRRRIGSSSEGDRIAWLSATAGPEQAFDQIDVLVHTSLEPEPFGRVLVEAMASRRPIVALRAGSTTELLDKTMAVFAEGPDGASLAAALKYLVADRARAKTMAERAAQRAMAFSPAAVARTMDAEYERTAE